MEMKKGITGWSLTCWYWNYTLSLIVCGILFCLGFCSVSIGRDVDEHPLYGCRTDEFQSLFVPLFEADSKILNPAEEFGLDLDLALPDRFELYYPELWPSRGRSGISRI